MSDLRLAEELQSTSLIASLSEMSQAALLSQVETPSPKEQLSIHLTAELNATYQYLSFLLCRCRSGNPQLYYKVLLDHKNLLPLPEDMTYMQLTKLLKRGVADSDLPQLVDGEASACPRSVQCNDNFKLELDRKKGCEMDGESSA